VSPLLALLHWPDFGGRLLVRQILTHLAEFRQKKKPCSDAANSLFFERNQRMKIS